MKYLLLLCGLLFPVSTLAASASLTAVSDYRSFGRTNSEQNPALQGTLWFTHDSGFYFGNWASTTDYGPTDDTIFEWDLYFGYQQKLNDNWSVDAGIAPYLLFGDAHSSDSNFFEFYSGLTYLDNTSLTAYYTPNYAGMDFKNYRLLLSHSFALPHDYKLGVNLAQVQAIGTNKRDWTPEHHYYQYGAVSLAHDWFGLTWQAVAMTTTINRTGEREALVLKISKAWNF